MKKHDNVILLLDESGSMGAIGAAAADMANSIVAGWKVALPEAAFTLHAFSYSPRVMVPPTRIGSAPIISYRNSWTPRFSEAIYQPNGQTNLFEALWRGIDQVDGRTLKGPDHGFMWSEDDSANLVVVITDGEHNWTRTFTPTQTVARLRKLEERGNWTFAFNVPAGKAAALVRDFRVSSDNVREWEQTTRGAEETTQANVAAVTQYAKARAGGASATRTMYAKVKTDLAKLKPEELRAKASNLSGRFLLSEVDKDGQIKSWYERAHRRAYIFGSIYYMLSKPEKVQPNKEVIVRHTVTGEVWGGKEARTLIGLPIDGVTHAKLDPGNHDRYQVFVQSGSTNRKLSKGDLVMIDSLLATPIEPTWEKSRQAH